MYFRDIIGQQEVIERLIRSVKTGKIPHAQLFTGAAGTGTLQCALAYARYISCTDKGETEACGKCSSCLKFDKLIHPDIHFVYPIYKTGAGKKSICDDFLKQWRSIVVDKGYFSYNQWLGHINAGNAQGMIYAEESDELLRKLSLKAYESEYKIVIIWLPEKMHESCSNKLLKLLEEPPEKTIFLMVTENPAQLLTTVLSRSQIIRFNSISTSELCEVLSRKHGLNEADALNFSRLSGGSYIAALENMEENEDNEYFLEQFKRCMRGAYVIANFPPEKKLEKQKGLKELKTWSEEMAKAGREQEKKFLSYAQKMIRENFIMNIGNSELVYLNQSETGFSKKFYPFINHKNIVAFMSELELAEKHIESNVNAKLVFFDLALQSIIFFKK